MAASLQSSMWGWRDVSLYFACRWWFFWASITFFGLYSLEDDESVSPVPNFVLTPIAGAVGVAADHFCWFTFLGVERFCRAVFWPRGADGDHGGSGLFSAPSTAFFLRQLFFQYQTIAAAIWCLRRRSSFSAIFEENKKVRQKKSGWSFCSLKRFLNTCARRRPPTFFWLHGIGCGGFDFARITIFANKLMDFAIEGISDTPPFTIFFEKAWFKVPVRDFEKPAGFATASGFGLIHNPVNVKTQAPLGTSPWRACYSCWRCPLFFLWWRPLLKLTGHWPGFSTPKRESEKTEKIFHALQVFARWIVTASRITSIGKNFAPLAIGWNSPQLWNVLRGENELYRASASTYRRSWKVWKRNSLLPVFATWFKTGDKPAGRRCLCFPRTFAGKNAPSKSCNTIFYYIKKLQLGAGF